MKRPFSLATRLVVWLLAAQILGALATTLAIELFVDDEVVKPFDKNLDGLAVPRVYALLTESLVQQADHHVEVAPSPALRAELLRAPQMRFAVYDTKTRKALPGSSRDLVASLGEIRLFSTSHLHFSFEDDDHIGLSGHLSDSVTPFGKMLFATYGHKFRFEDLFYSLKYEVMAYLRYFLLETLIAVGIGWAAFRRGLSPLNRVAQEAERIDLGTLHQRLPLDDVPGEAMPLVVSFNNALARLDESSERQRRFLVNAAHELRTPVAILLERLDHPFDAAALAKLRRDGHRIGALVEQLLAAFRLDKGAGAARERVDLREIAEAIVDDHALLAVKAGRHIALEAVGDRFSTISDKLALHSILANLVLNALRAEPEGGSVILRLLADACIEVEDHGAGVEPADRQKIFEPFWRKNDDAMGSGLGLAITRELVEKLGGTISVGETLGGGATFRLRLPFPV